MGAGTVHPLQEVRSVKSHSTSKKLLVLLFGLSLLAAACGGSSDDSSDKGTTTQVPPSTVAAADVPQGGNLVVGAEQEPDCADWMGTCGGSSWGYWMMGVTTMPRAFDPVNTDNVYTYAPSNLLTGEPKLETSPKQVVTYSISPDAVWSDGQPITSSDFKYTWEQVAKGTDIYDTTGYTNIESVDDSDPATAVVTFKTPFADWKSLFGGGYGIFPKHILDGKDRDAEMKDGYSWSGGPWLIKKWNKTVDITLVPNPKYWGDKPKLDSVTFKFQADTSAEFAAFKSEQVSVIYPQPQLDAVDQINAGVPNSEKIISTTTGNFEALWINAGHAPFDSKAVRQAVAYSIDREALVKRLFGGLGVTKPLNMLNAEIVAEYNNPDAFADYTKNLDKVDELLTGDGYAKGGDGYYAKGGKRLSFTVRSTAGNKRRELTQQIMQEQLKTAGIDMRIDNAEAGDLFGDILPKGDFDAGIYAQVLTGITPGLCNLFCAKNIPSASNDNSGQNWTRTNVPSMDPYLEKVDGSLDESVRKESGKQAMDIAAENVISLPIDPLPNILLWNTKVVGPISDNAILGPFWNINQWGVKA